MAEFPRWIFSKKRYLEKYAFVPNAYGWTHRFQEQSLFFLGKELTVEIHTRELPNKPEKPPSVSKQQIELLELILSEAETVLSTAEHAITRDNADHDKDFISYICNPHIWIGTDQERWTLVVERTDNSDFGYHVEFQGLEFIEVWAGD